MNSTNYNRDGIVARITESDANRNGWPVAAAWVVAPHADPDFLAERLKGIKSIPGNFRFLRIHERLLTRMDRRKRGNLFSEVKAIGAGLFVYTLRPSMEILMEPRRPRGNYARYWPEILEQIETYRFLEKF